VISPEIRVMVSPVRAYATYAPSLTQSGLWIAIRRPLFVALIQGVAISMVATRTVALPVVLGATACWTMAAVVQLLAAAPLLAAAHRRGVNLTRAIDLLFLGHAPWSLWLLAAAAVMTWGAQSSGLPWIVILTMVVPAAITARIVYAFSRGVLAMERRAALRHAALHQTIIWSAFVAFIAAAVALWPRILGAVLA
jgi:hypothetical protein